MKRSTTQSAQSSIGNRRISGQGLTEYIIIVALIAIASIAAVSFFGSGVKASFLALGADLVGAPVVDKQAVTTTSYDKAKTTTETQTTLQNYNK